MNEAFKKNRGTTLVANLSKILILHESVIDARQKSFFVFLCGLLIVKSHLLYSKVKILPVATSKGNS